MALRLNSNDATTQQWSAPFWASSEEVGTLSGLSDYLSAAYLSIDVRELLLDYRYTAGQVKQLAAVFVNPSVALATLRDNTTLAPSNDNPEWARRVTFSEGVSANASAWYGTNLRFQTVGNDTDNFRIWYNQLPVESCNQAGGIGGQGDGGSWFHELSFPSDTPGCPENTIRGMIGTNGGGGLMGEALLEPADAYEQGIMYVFVR